MVKHVENTAFFNLTVTCERTINAQKTHAVHSNARKKRRADAWCFSHVNNLNRHHIPVQIQVD